MPMQRSKQRKRPPGTAPHRIQGPTSGGHFPSAQTLFRINLFDRHIYRELRKVPAEIKPILLLRDRERIERIKQATAPAALLDLAPEATGLAERAWEDWMQQLGAEVLPMIVERLKQAPTIRDVGAQTRMRETLIAHLRWRGDAGAEALRAAFDSLDDFSRSLASVVLGLLRAGDAADQIWDYYQKVARDPRGSELVGALWGLVDLEDERVGGAVVDLLEHGHAFYERLGFVALAGDARAIGPLFRTLVHMREDEPEDVMMAIAAIGHRIGREALSAEIARVMPATRPPEEAKATADQILARTARDVEEYFSLYFRGPTHEDIAQAMKG